MLNSYEAARDLLGKATYSDRPHMPFMSELVGLNRSIVLSPYGDTWKMYRKLLHPVLQKSAIEIFWADQQSAARDYLRALLDAPHDFRENLRVWVRYPFN